MLMKALSMLLSIVVLGLGSSAFAGNPCPDCSVLDFGKKIELKLLQPMLKMSIPEKIRYIQSFGVDLYKVADPQKETPTVAFLPEAPAKQFPKYIKLFNEGVIGIYMTPNNSMYGVKKPTILFIESADHWTLIHEFSHYLFDRARSAEGSLNEGLLVNSSDDAQEDYFDAREKFRSRDGYVNDEHKRHTIMSFVNYAQVQLIFAKTCEFEETTIEKILRGAYSHHNPVGFRESDFERSTRYIRSTSAKGQQNLNFLLQDCEVLPQTLSDNDKELKAQLAKTCAKVQQLKEASAKVLQGLNIQLSP